MTRSDPVSTSTLFSDVRTLLTQFDGFRPEHARIGLDVVSISWFERVLETSAGRAMTQNSFTASERDYCAGRPDRYAVRWAAKEAVAKAIGTGFRGLRPADIEILHHPHGQPGLAASSASVWPENAQTWRWFLSLCHENDAAVALAFAIPVVGQSRTPDTRGRGEEY